MGHTGTTHVSVHPTANDLLVPLRALLLVLLDDVVLGVLG
eukprot:CAMPEP_0167798934 /NCGR_PEP_ID=MMETSP0111_2-20121227/16666_1 /TAXON_ID=91324 /ORGANISM="Lotharella globosa, Strain CCCM811" /LENGTH=39 /DNA_ID= /DNA_START= /DNA_END= /DNA_ORIENTATION=